MTREEALKIIKDESLTNYKWFTNEWIGNRRIWQDYVAISYTGGKWLTYIIDERDSVMDGTQRYFSSEDEAIDSFIKRLRGVNEIIEMEVATRKK